MIDALRIIAAKSPYAGEQAVQCIRAIQAKSPIVQQRYNRVVELAFGDNMADFTQEDRSLIASYIDTDADTGAESRTQTVRFRATPSEEREIQMMADAAGKDKSEFIRSLIWPE